MSPGGGRRPAGGYLAAVATASPACCLSQAETLQFLLANYGRDLSRRSRAVLSRIFAHPAIRRRHFALPEPSSLLGEDPDAKVQRFTSQAVELAGRAARQALGRAAIEPAELAGLVVNTCTGYLCPGLSSYLVEELRLRQTIQAFDLVGAGCGGALPNLQLAGGILQQTGGPVLSVAVEICSATFQMGDDFSLLLSNGLFGDGAAAVVLQERAAGWEIMSSVSRQVPAHREAIRYVHRQGQLHNRLSDRLPDLLGEIVPEVVGELLQPWELAPRAVEHWACHAGGAKIVQILQTKLGLTDGQLRHTRRVLAEYGNISSPTVLFGLGEIMAGQGETAGEEEGEWCVLLAFGAGLSVHAMLLRRAGGND